MDNKTATFTFTFTFFTLLFLYTVSAARPTATPPVTNPTTVRTDDPSKLPKASLESVASSGRSKILLPGEKVISEKPTNDLTSRTNFSKFHPINRHFSHVRPHRQPKHTGTHRRPCLKHTQYMIPIPQTEVSSRNDKVAEERANIPKLNNENIVRSKGFRGEVPENWLKVKHHYGSRRQHNNQNHDSERNKIEKNVTKTKNVFDREKMKSLGRQQKQIKKNHEDHKTGLMKNIRKFLKHTFD